MAQIEIEKKKPVWPWVLLVILVLGFIGYEIFDNDENEALEDEAYVEETDTYGTVENESMKDMDNDSETYVLGENSKNEIAALQTHLNSDGEMGIDHEYTHGALAQLISAVRATANDLEVEIDAELAEANEKADHIMKNPTDVDHANKIKSAAQSIAQALLNIQSERFPELNSEANAVQQSANDIIVDTQTLNQKGDVKQFFDRAEELLTKMN
ncbi:MAG: hypothetical protein R3213_08720 [Flavobacteriaceae bacterium]|nr:hypothetical protein [Flavobacteriaceae bacterium]